MRGASMRLPARQRGLALLVLLALFATAGAYMLVRSLNQSSTALILARAEKNRAVMQQAKAALIAWAASETSQPTSGQGFQPGALPCPDVDNNGTSDYSGATNCSGLLGRLPYSTLGIEDLRDASGERLWYAVSSNFFRSTNNVINSDKQGTLTISGLAPASNVIAVVLAPGTRLGAQDRSSAGTNTAANYLEGTNGIANSTNYVTAVEKLNLESTDPPGTILFNDQLLAITQQDLMSVVEPVVAARIQRDIVAQYIYDSDHALTDKDKLWSDDFTQRNKSRYFDAWGGFPFAAPFANPGSSSFTGVAGTYEGLSPVVGSLTYDWTLGSGSVVQTGGSGTVTSTNCASTTGTKLKCSVTYNSGAPTIRMSGTVNGIGFSFVQLSQLSDVSATSTINTRTLSGSLNSAGAGIVMLDATLRNRNSSSTVTITINNGGLVTSALISPTDGFAGWFTRNEWHQQTYYAVSAGYAPGGSGSCTAGVTCLTVNNLATTPNNDKRAILILAGRSLAGAARPSANLSDYLEGQNTSAGDNVFEHGLGKASSAGGAINDRVVVVAP